MSAKYNFAVTDISYVVEKRTNRRWEIYNDPGFNKYIIRFAVDGEAFCSIDGNYHAVKKGDLLFYAKNAPQASHSNFYNPWAFYSVAFDADFYGTSDSFESLLGITHCPNFHAFSTLFSDLNNAWLTKKTGYLIKCRGILMEILYLMISNINPPVFTSPCCKKIEKALSVIHENHERKYSVCELADISELSSSHFRTIFKKMTGMTSVQYQNKIKINKANDLLLSGYYNVSEAANHVGFSDTVYFSKLYKKITGINPTDYLKNC